MTVSHEDGVDVFRVYKTGGSNWHGREELVAEFS